ncbi:hypothetical protein ACFQ07_15845 [Actinomadura adrarensis]|uniref:Uncharacterized protein n=1 Tax=Actinomadura adrarensis TaxID=1819600 RepID=A0ABW3CJK3_9ACTN
MITGMTSENARKEARTGRCWPKSAESMAVAAALATERSIFGHQGCKSSAIGVPEAIFGAASAALG